jgi:hypothetical protein
MKRNYLDQNKNKKSFYLKNNFFLVYDSYWYV